MLATSLLANPRDKDWNKVASARAKEQPRTAIALLRPIETKAFAEHAWAEGVKALAMRIILEPGNAKEPTAGGIRQLDAETAAAPPEAQPMLLTLQASWMLSFYQHHSPEFHNRSRTTEPNDGNFETWDLPHILAEIDRRFQAALAHREALQKIPVADFGGLLVAGGLDDSIRPTLYDFVAHTALGFYSKEIVAASKPQDTFEISADSAAFDSTEKFLAWQPETTERASPKLRALRIYQDLLVFHQADPDRSAFLHCDLERIRWAGKSAVGESKAARLDTALRAFIAANATHLLSADARRDLAEALIKAGRHQDAHRIAKAGAEAFPKHPFGKLCAELTGNIEEADLSVDTQSTWTPAGEDIVVNHRNLDHVWFRAYRREWKPDHETFDSDNATDYRETLQILKKSKPAYAWDAPLPDGKDFVEHLTRLPAPKDLPPGFYVILASGRKDFSMKDNSVYNIPIHVTKFALLVWESGNATMDGIVTDAVTGAPLAGIEVKRWRTTKTKAAKAQTTQSDADGFFSFPYISDTSYGILVAASLGTDRVIALANGGDDLWPPPEPDTTAVLFTDRCIYRPGQTIHFKGILCATDPEKGAYHTVAGKTVKIDLDAPKGKTIDSLELQTNERGSFAGSFTAPSGGLLGEFNVGVGKQGSASVQIEEYKRPKFFATLAPPEAQAMLGEKVEMKGRAVAYTDAAIEGAKVQWSVKRRTTCPEWAFWRHPDMQRPRGEQEIANGTSLTAADGSFSIAFVAEPDKTVSNDAEPVFTFGVSADITDPSGETRLVHEFVSVAYTALRAAVTSTGMPEAGKECRFTVRTETHDDEGRAAEGLLTIHKLIEPKICPRRGEEGADWEIGTGGRLEDPADPRLWQTGEVVARIPIKTDDKGEVEVGQVLPAGLFRAVFETKDGKGRNVQAMMELQVLQPDATKFPTKIPFFADSPKWEVQPGEIFTLFWGSGHAEARACIEWRKGSKLLKREWSTPGRTQQAFTWPIDESMRGGFSVNVLQTTMNRMSTFSGAIEVPWSNKELKLRWEHLTSKLEPGAKDTWTAVITGPDDKPADAEMVATLYDASLDGLFHNDFGGLGDLFRYDEEWRPDFDYDFSNSYCDVNGFEDRSDRVYHFIRSPYRYFADQLDFSYASRFEIPAPSVDLLLWRAFGGGPQMPRQNSGGGLIGGAGFEPTPVTRGFRSADAPLNRVRNNGGVEAGPTAVIPRKNLQETAFFHPQLTTDAEGRIRISFTMPEALTTWRFLGFAHDKNLRSGLLEGETVTSKDLMVQPNPPRFLREGDVLDFTVKITNRGNQAQTGTARLTLADAATQADRTAALGITAPDQPFSVPANESRIVSWKLTIPDGAGFLTYKAVAAGPDRSDGEEGWLPVIPRRVLVTESMSLPLREPGTKEFTFTKLKDSGNSPTLQSQFVHVQVVANPAWLAVMALPYLMDFPHECAEQTFNRYYANALARHIAQSDPEIRQIFDQWRNTPALDSPLTKNAELKGILLEETPWLREANDESQARRKVGLLFDDSLLDSEIERCLGQLKQMQLPDGLWPWFPGGENNRHISLTIATGFARLRALGVETDITPALKALAALDQDLTQRYAAIRREAETDPDILKANHLNPDVAQFLYTRTLFLKDKAVAKDDKAAFEFFTAQTKNHWTQLNGRMSRAHAALALFRLGDKGTAGLITRSLREHATVDAETGMHWKDDETDCWWWWQAPVETQAMMIEVFHEIDRNPKAVEDCQTWLIQQKQVRAWRSTKATADAVHALVIGGVELSGKGKTPAIPSLLSSANSVEVSLGGEKPQPAQSEAGTGFFETRIPGPAVKPALGDIALTKTGTGMSWASVHWLYLEDLAKLTGHQTKDLSLEKSLFIRRKTPQGPVLEPLTDGKAKVGDELVTRLVLRNDRAMEFLHLKDMRGSGTEPLNVLSGYRWQDGFAYYEVTRDTASHFFIDRLPPGVHVFETSARIQHAGNYQTGTAEIQCMYAPEFNARSASVAVLVVK